MYDQIHRSSWLSARTFLTCLKYLAGAGAAGSVLITVGLWYFQRSMIYPSYAPEGSRKQVLKPSDIGLPYEDVTLTTVDLVKLKAYVIPARRRPVQLSEWQSLSLDEKKKRSTQEIEDWTRELGEEDAIEYARKRPTVIIFHANAGNMGHRIPIARKFNVDLGCNVFMLSYRGYGLSEGHASEFGIKLDVETAIEYVTKHPILGGSRLILYGQSIGGAVSLYAASQYPDLISGLIVENTFTSLLTVVPYVLPHLPRFLLPILLTERWDSTDSISRIPADLPVLLMSGKKDMMVPPAEMKRLRSLREASGGKARWREFDSEHNDTILAKGYWEEVKDWMEDDFASGMVALQKDEEKNTGIHTMKEDVAEKDWDVVGDSDLDKESR